MTGRSGYDVNEWGHYRHAGVQERALRQLPRYQAVTGPYIGRPPRSRGLWTIIVCGLILAALWACGAIA